MSDRPRFSAAQAAAALPDLPAPDQVRGPDLVDLALGEARLRFLSDGSMSLPFRVLAPDAPDGALEALCGVATAPDLTRSEMTHLLLDLGAERVLVDTGAGGHWQCGAGRLPAHMAANGIDPASVTRVVLTHLHPDHVWGSIHDEDTPAFPNATYLTGAGEIAFWGAAGLADRVSSRARPAVEGTARVIAALGDRLSAVAEGDEVAPGLSVLATPGHTPGHLSLILDAGPGLIVTGDAVVHDVVSFAEPDWSFGFDLDDARARISRRRLLDMAASGGHAICGYHWRWPGIGHAERSGPAYRFVPRP